MFWVHNRNLKQIIKQFRQKFQPPPKKKTLHKNRRGLRTANHSQNSNKLTRVNFRWLLGHCIHFLLLGWWMCSHTTWLLLLLSLEQPMQPFIWLDASQDTSASSSGISALVWPGSFCWLPLTEVAQEPDDSSASDETWSSDDGVATGIAFLKI